MRSLILGLVLLALGIPSGAHAAVRVSAFYYPWYGTLAADGAYSHWGQRGHLPPNDIASAYYPTRGLYSSSDRLVVGAQMAEIHAAGIDEIAVSWWGRGSAEDARLPLVLAAARADDIAVAAHLEPYDGRTVAGTVADVAYLRSLGVKTFYIYRALDFPVGDWAAAASALHAGGGVTIFGETQLVGAAAAAGFDGVYTYDIVTFGGWIFQRLCDEAHAQHLLCAPSVGPGYDARRGSGDPVVKLRRHGATYDAMWRAAITAHADRITITSYNEWHEGTQIEPATPCRHGAYRYLSYDGAWGLYGQAASNAYLTRTRYWSDVFRSTSPVPLNTSAS